ncbi:MAG: glycosyltransferase family 2 protein [Candidatus Woesebacteria bacterium]|jgi:glycosyltransferase involved in cell wall biosynthesis
MKKNNQITAIIIAKNEEKMIKNCLKTVLWCQEILIIDNGSTDDTVKIAEDFRAKVISMELNSFAKLRNTSLKRVKTDWMFFIDADERVTPTLAKEILVQIETCKCSALRMKRKNICYGHEFKHGNWDKDFVTRIFKTDKFKTWYGDIHESPSFEGKVQDLQTTLIHLTHRNTTDGLRKTINWTKIEAELLFKANIKPVTFKTILRKGIMEFIRKAIFAKGYKDGLAGLIEALVQAINKFLIYIQVWEMQQKPSLADQYEKYELKIKNLWKKGNDK